MKKEVTGLLIAAVITFLSACTTHPDTVRQYPAVTPNPAVKTHPAITADNSPNPNDVPVVNTYYPSGVGININGYGPSNANYYEAGFFGNF